MESLSLLQEDIKEKMFKMKSNVKKSPKDRLTIPHVEIRLENLEQQWLLFRNTHTQIINKCTRSALQNSDYFKNCLYDEVEEFYIDFKTELKELLIKLKCAEPETKPNISSNENIIHKRVKLPEIKIPIFSGKYTEWQSFRDLFSGLVHESRSLDDAQKFYYLRGHVTGEAEQLLRNLQTTADSYSIAWQKLNKTYNNKRFLANGILKRLLNQKGLVSESAFDIKKLINTTSDCLDSLKNIGIDVSTWDILIIHIISSKLDKDTRKAWEFKVSSDSTDELPSFSQFSEFLNSRFRGLENLDFKEKPNIEKRITKSFHVVKNLKVSESCAFCKASHKLSMCKMFCKEPSDTRRNFVMENRLCFVCLNPNHSAKYCKNIVRCRVCKRRHHSLLHPSGVSGYTEEDVNDTVQREASSSQVSETKEDVVVNHHKYAAQAEGSTSVVACLSTGNNIRKTVLLATAVVQAQSKDGTFRTIRALLDQGSQGSFINESLVQYLGLTKVAAKVTVTGVGSDKGVTSRSTVALKLKSRYDPHLEFEVNALVLNSITSILPVKKLTRVEWVDLELNDLADPEYNRPSKIDVLLGADVYSQVIREGIKRNTTGSLLAQNSAFGWILSGTCEVDSGQNHSQVQVVTVRHACLDSDDFLKKFWELEAAPSARKKMLTDEEQKCEKLFTDTTRRDESGRFVVVLPFREADPICKYGNSRQVAIKRFHALESKFKRNKDLKDKYTQVIQEYLSLGHMRLLTETEKQNKHAVYLPHHAVIRDDKDTTKVRVVFDASCTYSNGKSLNDALLVGPTLQPELRHLLLRWRIHPICIISDIVKMYRQVRVTDECTDFQRIVWRDDQSSEIKDYKLLTVTFGTASAPYLAVRSLQQIAHEEGKNYPMAAESVLNDYYVDDLMCGSQTPMEGIELYRQMNELLSKAGFQLQKWSSNHNEVLEYMDKDYKRQDNDGKRIMVKQDEIVKTLGLTWNRKNDTFQYSVQLPLIEEPVTKRKVLSDISRLFDPLGWVAPVIILAKIQIQKLWILGIGWDEAIPNEMKKEWYIYREELQLLTNFSIPRWLHMRHSDKQIDLHGFCDASKSAYAAVVYVRTVDAEGKICVSLLTAKTNVAPIKTISIPRLELCGAVLLTNLLVEVAREIGVGKSNIHAWTDSEIVLAWLNSHPNRWKTFVANRVSEILSASEPQRWNHVQSKQNPADCASRGLYPSELLKSQLWLEGPDFLKKKVIPVNKIKPNCTSVEEIKVHAHASINKNLEDENKWIWNKYSSLTKLVRVVAYCRRVLEWRKPETERKGSYLTVLELKQALHVCIRVCQNQNFLNEIMCLKNKKNLKRTVLSSLNPYLDSSNILRVGGRLEHSNLSADRKHPVLMPYGSPLTSLLVAEAHRLTLHGGPQLMISYLSTKYYIIGVKRLVRSYVRKCVTCRRYNSSSRVQLMGQLPTARVTPCRPFQNSGVDYAGPISLRTYKGRGRHAHKGYICLFVCMATKAIHLEIVSDLTSEGFLAAFRRFVARRGQCREIWSDNGTNFQGASRELKILAQHESSSITKEIAETLANEGTAWHFIPPHTPNFGGLWEAGIKSCKGHLRRVIGNTTLTYEEMATLLCQVEACLNSRPLCRISDSDTIDPLTPGHFLVGGPLVNVPDYDFTSAKISSLKRWHLIQQMTQVFWRRWSSEYLTTLLHRYKWANQTPEPQVGDIVLVKEDNLPPSRWLLGRVVEKHPGLDNLTRVVTLRTSAATIKRPTSKLCVLPLE